MDSGGILISSAGRRVGLLGCIRDSLSRRRDGGAIFTADCAGTAPAAFTADTAFRVPRCTDSRFTGTLLDLCRQHRIQLVIPTIDTELPVYAANRERFAEIGVVVAVSEPSVIDICCNKLKTHDWLVSNGFPTVRQTDPTSALREPSRWPFPLIAKPYNGSAGVGVRVVESTLELEAVNEKGNGYIVQEFARGREFTVNVYVSRSGKCVCAVPHWRLEVRAGEVSKGITAKDRRLIDLARAVAERLPGAYGALNIQCMVDDDSSIRIIEINGRFGGGYPLAHRAGARFTDWLLNELDGHHLTYFDDWTDSLAMLRYDDAVFVPGNGLVS